MGEPSKPTRAWLVGAVVTIAAIFIFGLVGSELDARAKEDADGGSLDLWGFLFVYGGILGGIVGSLWGMVAGLLGRQTRWVRRTTLLGLGLAPLAARLSDTSSALQPRVQIDELIQAAPAVHCRHGSREHAGPIR